MNVLEICVKMGKAINIKRQEKRKLNSDFNNYCVGVNVNSPNLDFF